MIILKEANPLDSLFAEKIAYLDFNGSEITLTFDKQFSIGRGKNYKKGSSLTYEIFSPKDLKEFKQKTGIKELPCELFDNELFKKVFYFMGGQ